MQNLKCTLVTFMSVVITLTPLHAASAGGEASALEQEVGGNETKSSSETVTLKTVTTTAVASDADARESSTLATLSVGRNEIERHGDRSLSDVLRRLPGITVGSDGGQGTSVRMRGLGGAYTQILVDGQPAPAGFSVDSISPDIVERVDIVRSGTADMSAQGIAGTINVVLRKTASKAQRDLKIGLIDGAGAPTYSLSGRLSGGSQARSYTVGAAMNREHRSLDARIEQWGTTDLLPTLRRTTHREGEARIQRFNLTPRVSWKLSETHSLRWESLISQSRVDGSSDDDANTAIGSPQTFPRNRLRFATDTTIVQNKGTWTRQIGDYSQLDARLGVTSNRRKSVAAFTGFNEDGVLILDRDVDSNVRDLATVLGGKLTSPISDEHTLGFGWDGEFSRREEDRIQQDITPTGLPPINLDEHYLARLARLALFVQDEWQVGPKWSAYLGVRWEGLRTDTTGNMIESVDNRFSVLSPTIQSVWKLADNRRDQIRLAIGRTYKSPQLVELIPRRFIANNNSQTDPDTQGNPDLRPEIAWGVDLAYERFWEDSNSFSANVYARRIDDVILQELSNFNGTWISVPTNNGQAKVHGIELESQVNLASVLERAPNIDVRINLGKNWSSVDSVPGPDNRLSRQNPLSGNIGMDYRAKAMPLTLGGNFNYQQAVVAQRSAVQGMRTSARRIVDLYGVWKFNEKIQMRLSAANVLHQSNETDATYSNNDSSLLQRTITPTHVVVNATLEMKL